MSDLDCSIPVRPADWDGLGRVLIESFGFAMPGRTAEEAWSEYVELVGANNFRCVRRNGRIVAGLALYRAGQWFGGRSLRMDGVAAVGVAPEARGSGVAGRMMAGLMGELHDDGVPLSTLYASTAAPYRRVGYEWAGTSCRFELDTRALPLGSRELALHRVEPTHPAIRLSHERIACERDGNLDRNDPIWTRFTRQIESPVHAYLVGSATDPEGYIIFTQAHRPTGGYDLAIRDWAALTPGAARRLWTLMADHRSMARQVRWTGPCADPMLGLALDAHVSVVDLSLWMMRLVHVPNALSQRGYPVGIEAILHLEVIDPRLSANHGRFVLRVANGQGEVSAGGQGDLKVSIGALAPLYTGYQTPYQLTRSGGLTGSPEALAMAAQLFAGPEPWMAARF